MQYQPTLTDNLINALKADIESRGWKHSGDQYAYIAGYLSSMLQGFADASPKVRKEIERTLESIKARA